MSRPISRLVRLSAAVACAGLCAATPVRASTPRLFALGGDGAYLEDAVNARVWYGSLADHGGWAAVESGPFDQDGYPRGSIGPGERTAGPAAGAQVPLGADGGLGTAALWWNGRAAGGGVGELGQDRLADAWQVMFARDLGPLTAGLSVRHAGGDQDPTSSLHHEATRDDLGLGARLDLGARAYLDLAGELVRLADESTLDGAAPVSSSTAGSFGLRGRAFLQVADQLVVVPMVEHRIEDREPSLVARPLHRRLWRTGAGLTWLPDPDHLLLLAAERYDSRAGAGDGPAADGDVLALRAGVEARVHALLTVRMAAGYRRTALGVEGGPDTVRHDVPLSAGLAAHAGPVDLEFSLANLPPVGPDGLAEAWSADARATWMSAGVNWWF